MKKKSALFVTILCLISWNLKSQNWEIISSVLDCRDAVIENDTLWVATTGGLCKYLTDGTLLRTYTSKDGLSKSDCRLIVKDSQGKKYISTTGFVSVFDGKSFTTVEPNPSTVYKSYGTSAMRLDANGHLRFFNAIDGVSKLEGGVVVTQSLASSFMGIIPDFDKQGNLWYSTNSGELFYYDGTSSTPMNKGLNASNNGYFYMGAKIIFDHTNRPYINFMNQTIIRLNSNNTKWDTLTVRSPNLAFDANDKMVVSKNDSVYFYNNTVLEKRIKMNFQFAEWSMYAQIFVNKIITEGNLTWVLTTGGLLRYDNTTLTKISPKSIPPGIIMALAAESNGKIWASTTYAISSFENNIWKIYPSTDTKTSYGGAYWINIDNQNVKWFGTYDNGMLTYDGQNWSYVNKTNTTALKTNSFTCSAFKGNNKWFGTSDKGIYFFDGTVWSNFTTANGLPSDNIAGLAIGPDGTIWCATDKGVAKYANSQWTKMNTLKAYTIYVDSKGRVWTGHDNTIQYFNGTIWTTISDYVITRSTMRLGFGDVQFLVFKEDAAGKIWMGYKFTASQGGYFYYDNTNVVDPDTDNSTYIDAPISSIVLDKSNRVWLGATGCTVINETISGIEEQKVFNKDISVYPVPSTKEITVRLTDYRPVQTVEMHLYNSQGQLVLVEKMNQPEQTISIAKLPQGVYFLNAADKRYETLKIVKR